MSRKDAVANRARAVAAATDVFRREGFGVGVETIAREAGINVSTLYRNFASKTELILAVGESLIEPLAATCDELIADDAPDVVGRLLRAHAVVAGENRAFNDTFGTHDLDPAIYRKLIALAAEIVKPIADRGHADASLAAHFDVTDLLIALRMISSAVIAAGGVGRDPQAYAEVVARGLQSAHS